MSTLVWLVFAVWFLLRYARYWTELVTPLAAAAALAVAMVQSVVAASLLVLVYSIISLRRRATRLVWAVAISILGAFAWFFFTVEVLRLTVWMALRYGVERSANNVVQLFYGDYSHTGWVFCAILGYFLWLARKVQTS